MGTDQNISQEVVLIRVIRVIRGRPSQADSVAADRTGFFCG